MAIELGYGENEANQWHEKVNLDFFPTWLDKMWE